MSGIINSVADAFRTPQERTERAANIAALSAIKIACAVTMAAMAVFFICIPSFFTFLFCGAIAFGARELNVVASNTIEIHRNITAEIPARLSRDNMIAHLSKDTLVAEYFLNCLVPLDE